MSQKFESRSSIEKEKSEALRRTSPAPISQREPILSENFPASGATKTIRIVIGKNVAPIWMGE